MASTAASNGSTDNPVIAVRQYIPEDQELVAALFRESMLFYTDSSDPAHQIWLDHIEHVMHADLGDIQSHYLREGGGSNFLVATATMTGGSRDKPETVVVGTLGIEKHSASGVAELRRVSVKQEYRRFGIGRLLMSHATQWAKEQNYSQLVLENAATQTLAHKFYESLGYKFTKTSVLCDSPYFELTHFEKAI